MERTIRTSVARTWLSGLYSSGGIDLADARSEDNSFSSIGLKIGRDWSLSKKFNLRLRGELSRTLTTTRAFVGGERIWKTPAINGSIGLVGVFEF